MNIPVPSAGEVARMQALCREYFGRDFSRGEAFDALCRIVAFVYLTEYEPVRPLRPQGAGRKDPEP